VQLREDVRRMKEEARKNAAIAAALNARGMGLASSSDPGGGLTVAPSEIHLVASASMGAMPHGASAAASAESPGNASPMLRGGAPSSPMVRRPPRSETISEANVDVGRSAAAATADLYAEADDAPEVTEHVAELVTAAAGARRQCALALSALAMTGAATHGSRLISLGVLPALVALCYFGKDGDSIRERVSAAMQVWPF
jgi:hypothetical protein